MNHIKRGVLTLCMLASGAAFAAPVGVTIDTTKPGPVINKNIYGQFAEHLGTGIYEGIWVGPKSKIPNVNGWRKDVVGALKAMHVPLVRCRAAASPTNTTGATASARVRSVP